MYVSIRLLKRKLLLFLFFGGIISVVLYLFIPQTLNLYFREQRLNNLVPIVVSTTVSYEQEREIFGRPLRLKIPNISVGAIIEQVNITGGGEMGVPKGPADAAWFELGPRPGEIGSAVISGHYGWKDGIPAVFDNLYLLNKGDKIYIEDDRGETIVFVVRESQRYDPTADASTIFSSNDGKAHLNLITCEGVWSKDQKSYSKRLVVFADKEH